MSANKKIEWAHHTFNPWVGCTKVSPACDHCYAESWAKRSYEILSCQCAKARRQHVAKQKRCKPTTKTTGSDAFAWGWVVRIALLIGDFAQPSENKQLLLSYMDQQRPELMILNAKDRVDKKSDDHIHAGWRAGANAELNRGVGNSQLHQGLLT